MARILLVDDQPDIARLYQVHLEQSGYQVVIELDARAAASRLDDDVDAVVSDIYMPGLNGVELARELRARRAELPIVFVTGSDPSGALAREAAALGPVCEKTGCAGAILAALAELKVSIERRLPTGETWTKAPA